MYTDNRPFARIIRPESLYARLHLSITSPPDNYDVNVPAHIAVHRVLRGNSRVSTILGIC